MRHWATAWVPEAKDRSLSVHPFFSFPNTQLHEFEAGSAGNTSNMFRAFPFSLPERTSGFTAEVQRPITGTRYKKHLWKGLDSQLFWQLFHSTVLWFVNLWAMLSAVMGVVGALHTSLEYFPLRAPKAAYASSLSSPWRGLLLVPRGWVAQPQGKLETSCP